jgi:hypothetical protein
MGKGRISTSRRSHSRVEGVADESARFALKLSCGAVTDPVRGHGVLERPQGERRDLLDQ